MVTRVRRLRKKGVGEAVLFVDESNTGARKLYESLGFKLRREDRLLRFRALARTHQPTTP